MDKIVEELNITVFGECSHQFEKYDIPYGATMIFFSSQSHLSLHTFVDDGKLSSDLLHVMYLLKIKIRKSFVITLMSVHSILMWILSQGDEKL
jgi:S-adenosylmethionine/arginine decarboxylase-like enzyme